MLQQAKRMHKLKGSAGMLGAKAVHALAAQVEAACLAGNVQRATDIAEALKMQMQRLRDSATPVINAARARADEVAESAALPLAPARRQRTSAFIAPTKLIGA